MKVAPLPNHTTSIIQWRNIRLLENKGYKGILVVSLYLYIMKLDYTDWLLGLATIWDMIEWWLSPTTLARRQYVWRRSEVWKYGWGFRELDGSCRERGWERNCLFTPVIRPRTENGRWVIASETILILLTPAASSTLWRLLGTARTTSYFA